MGAAEVRRAKRRRQKQQATRPALVPSIVTEHETSHDDVYDAADQLMETMKNDPELKSVVERFALPDKEDEPEPEKDEMKSVGNVDNDDDSIDDGQFSIISKKKSRKLSRVSLAELKRLAPHPEVVELEDCTATHSLLLVQLKGCRNTVPVPRHWSRKRKYLAGKRGFVKPPFELPPFIRDTGVGEQRDAQRAADAAKSLKARARDRMHPKLGRLAVNYERLYDAFFKYQTRPILSGHGQVYFEGKEAQGSGGASEGRRRGMRPGMLSDVLREALGIASGGPPPWLFNMQRFGPPQAYPNLRLPGVNAPLPPGAVWGYHPGGWGRAPDSMTLLQGGGGDEDTVSAIMRIAKPVQSELWGEMEPEPEE